MVWRGIDASLISKDDEVVICVRDEHRLKTSLSIAVTKEGIVICVRDEHPSKAASPMRITEDEYPS